MLLSADRRQEIEERARVLRVEVWNERQSFWPDRNPRGLEVADPEIAAAVLGINFEYHEELRFTLTATRSEVAGLLDRRSGRVLVARRFGPQTARFTAAHELGHWLLHESKFLQHRDLPIEGLERQVRDPVEREADYFAAAFLMPRKYVRDQFMERFPTISGQFVFDHNSAHYLRPNDVAGLLYADENSLERELVLASARSYAGKYFESLAAIFRVTVKTMAIRLRELRVIRP